MSSSGPSHKAWPLLRSLGIELGPHGGRSKNKMKLACNQALRVYFWAGIPATSRTWHAAPTSMFLMIELDWLINRHSRVPGVRPSSPQNRLLSTSLTKIKTLLLQDHHLPFLIHRNFKYLPEPNVSHAQPLAPWGRQTHSFAFWSLQWKADGDQVVTQA